MTEYPIATDGLIARKAGDWARDKLAFLDRFFPAALNATARKRDRIYLDLFAGPGLNVVPESGEEFEGSPLRAVQVQGSAPSAPAFTQAIFCNTAEEEVRALHARIARLAAGGRVRVPMTDHLCADSNAVIAPLLRHLHPRAYIFAFADIEGAEDLPWRTLEALRRAHSSVDLYVLVPVEMCFNRLLGAKPEHRARHAPIFDEYFGDSRWRAIASGWVTDANGARVRRELLTLYLDRLRTLWRFAEVVEVGRWAAGTERLLYRMIFASDHPAGIKIGRWAALHRPDAQQQLDL